MFIFLFTIAVFTLVTSSFILMKAWSKNVNSEPAQKLGVALYISPAIFVPSMYKRSLKNRVIIANILLIISLILLAIVAVKL